MRLLSGFLLEKSLSLRAFNVTIEFKTTAEQKNWLNWIKSLERAGIGRNVMAK